MFKIYDYKRASVTFEKTFPSGMYIVTLRKNGEVNDKIRCDDYKEARAYCASFRKIAKGA